MDAANAARNVGSGPMLARSPPVPGALFWTAR